MQSGQPLEQAPQPSTLLWAPAQACRATPQRLSSPRRASSPRLAAQACWATPQHLSSPSKRPISPSPVALRMRSSSPSPSPRENCAQTPLSPRVAGTLRLRSSSPLCGQSTIVNVISPRQALTAPQPASFPGLGSMVAQFSPRGASECRTYSPQSPDRAGAQSGGVTVGAPDHLRHVAPHLSCLPGGVLVAPVNARCSVETRMCAPSPLDDRGALVASVVSLGPVGRVAHPHTSPLGSPRSESIGTRGLVEFRVRSRSPPIGHIITPSVPAPIARHGSARSVAHGLSSQRESSLAMLGSPRSTIDPRVRASSLAHGQAVTDPAERQMQSACTYGNGVVRLAMPSSSSTRLTSPGVQVAGARSRSVAVHASSQSRPA